MRISALLLSSLFLVAVEAQAGEVSLVSGLYKHDKTKVDGVNAGGSTTIEVGGRYGDKITRQQAWYTEVGILLKSYESGAGREAPDNFTGIKALGGIRYVFPDFSEKVLPYIAGAAGYQTDKTVSLGAADTVETETGGLVYKGLIGFQLEVDTDFFLGLETELFNSTLFGTQKVTTTTFAAGNTTSSKSETTNTELYFKSAGAFNSAQVLVGMRF